MTPFTIRSAVVGVERDRIHERVTQVKRDRASAAAISAASSPLASGSAKVVVLLPMPTSKCLLTAPKPCVRIELNR